jgi:hypothetical protein
LQDHRASTGIWSPGRKRQCPWCMRRRRLQFEIRQSQTPCMTRSRCVCVCVCVRREGGGGHRRVTTEDAQASMRRVRVCVCIPQKEQQDQRRGTYNCSHQSTCWRVDWRQGDLDLGCHLKQEPRKRECLVVGADGQGGPGVRSALVQVWLVQMYRGSA